MAFYLGSVRDFFTRYFKKEENEVEQVGKLEAYINVLYKLLIWEEPFFSASALIVAHMLFWVIFHFQLRLYGVIFFLLLVGLVLDASLENVLAHTEKPISGSCIRELGQLAAGLFHYLTRLRAEHPGTFCIGMCISFLTLSIISRTASGLLLSYLGFLTIVLTPVIIRSLPLNVKNNMKHAFRIISSDEGMLDETELLPTGAEEEAVDDGEDSRTDHTAESCANSFISGVTSMPSYLEAEGSIDGLDEEDLELTRNMRGITPSNLSTDSSDSEHKDMKFETKHFNRDSSSEEDNNYVQGLTFSEVDMVEKPRQVSYAQQIGADLLSNLGAVGSSLVSSVFRAGNIVPVKKSDSDSDFEIINTDDFQNNET